MRSPTCWERGRERGWLGCSLDQCRSGCCTGWHNVTPWSARFQVSGQSVSYRHCKLGDPTRAPQPSSLSHLWSYLPVLCLFLLLYFCFIVQSPCCYFWLSIFVLLVSVPMIAFYTFRSPEAMVNSCDLSLWHRMISQVWTQWCVFHCTWDGFVKA